MPLTVPPVAVEAGTGSDAAGATVLEEREVPLAPGWMSVVAVGREERDDRVARRVKC